MPFIFHRTKGKLTKSETPFPVEITEFRVGDKLVGYAQDVQSSMLQKTLISLADAKLIQDDPDWKGPKQQ